MSQAFPLAWPMGWPRWPGARAAAKFAASDLVYRPNPGAPGGGHNQRVTRELTVARALPRLQTELDRLGAGGVVLSTNVELRVDGTPRSDRAPPTDPGVACYFTIEGKPVVLACDKWQRVADNIVAIAKHIEALRGQDRWGVGSIARAFAGYQALPAPGRHTRRKWWTVLNLPETATLEQAEYAFLHLAKQTGHATEQGDHERMVELTSARDDVREQFGQLRKAS